MTPEQFTWWLQGFVEMNPNAMVTGTQWQIIKDHLALVFKKETPARVGLPFNPGPILAEPAKRPLDNPFLGTPGQPYTPVVTC